MNVYLVFTVVLNILVIIMWKSVDQVVTSGQQTLICYIQWV